ncbi:MAG: ATP synthase F1 subunit delta [Pseudomonadota bacterium]|nr:ATP synthase F1 subunit delta [Pseudomonadota bacterium]
MLQKTQFDNRAIAKYSKALMGIAVGNKSQNQIDDEIKNILKLFENDENFNVLFNSPLLNKKKQIAVVSSLFSVNKENKILVSKNLFGLIILLAKNSKIHLFKDILQHCIDLQKFSNKELKISVTSVSNLDEQTSRELKKIFSKNGTLDVKIINLIDKSLLGGLIIQIGSNLIDTSIKTKLNLIKNAMKGAN